MAITFPATPLTCTVSVALGANLTADPATWTWTDITQYVRFAQGISQTVGRPDESTIVNPGKGSMTLDNTDGRFTRRNPLGAYYGQLGYNTPIRATIDAGDGPTTRLAMFVNEWPSRWDRSGRDATVPIVLGGKLRQLTQGKQTVKSPQGRTILGAGPVAYWPLEDGAGSISAASGIVGGSPMVQANGGALFASVTPPAGSVGAAQMSPVAPSSDPQAGEGPHGGLTGTIGAPATVSSGWTVEFDILIHTLGNTGTRPMVIWTTPGGTWTYWGFGTYQTGLGLAHFVMIGGTDASMSNEFFPFNSGAYDVEIQVETWYHVVIQAIKVGANVNVLVWINGVLYDGGFGNTFPLTSFTLTGLATATLSGGIDTLHAVSGYQWNYAPALSQVAFYQDVSITPNTHYQAMIGFVGELAHNRISRVCSESGIRLTSSAVTSSAMGPQPVAADLDVLRDAEKVDGGVLYEVNWGLGYQSLAERYNQAVGLSLDFAAGDIAEEPQPADDDQRLRNQWTASRSGGNTVTAQQSTGPLGTGAGGPGTYDDNVTVNVATDDQLIHEARWRVHLGTVDEDRWPSIKMRLHGTPSHIDAWNALGYGGRINAANPPTQSARNTIDAVIEGFTERWDPLSWDVEMFTSPASAYRVTKLDDAVLGKLDTGGSTLTATWNGSAASFGVVTTLGPIWTQAGGDYPFDLNLAGQRVTVSAANQAVYDVFARTVAAGGWGTSTSGTVWTPANNPNDFKVVSGTGGEISPSVASSNRFITVPAGSTLQDVEMLFGPYGTVTGGVAECGIVLNYVDANNCYFGYLSSDTSGNLTAAIAKQVAGSFTPLASQPLPTPFSLASGNIYISFKSLVGGLLELRVYPQSTGLEPIGPTVTAIDSSLSGTNVGAFAWRAGTAPTMFPVQSFKLRNPQVFTVSVASVNGVSKSHPAGEAVSLWSPMVLGL